MEGILNQHNKILGIDTRAFQFYQNILSLFKIHSKSLFHIISIHTHISGPC